MKCPNCKAENTCGCNSCYVHRPKDRLTAQYMDGEFASCRRCGHREHVDAWLDIEMKEYKEALAQQALRSEDK